MQWFLWALSLFCAVLLWCNSQLKQDIATLRLQVQEAQAQALSVARAKEAQIERATEQTSTLLAAQVANNSACISTAATSTNGTETAAPSRSPDASARATQVALERLRRCEQRVLYEAKEYDLLAVHYNALLAIYEKAREVNNGYSKSEQRKD